MVLAREGITEFSVYKIEKSNKLVGDGGPLIRSAAGKKLAFCMSKISG